jgi:phosphoserine aminotransferase
LKKEKIMESRVFNFSAGPAMLPLEVLEKAKAELINYGGTGMSVMEMSHRSKAYMEIIAAAEKGVRDVLNVPDDYSVLFLQGGASLQFAMIPMNLYVEGKPVDAINTGAWTKKAIAEVKNLGECNVIASSDDKNFSYIPNIDGLKFNQNASYTFVTSNNTIFGTQYNSFPEVNGVPLIADMSSDIFSKKIDVSKFGMIFAGAQKNIGPSGVTLVIMRKDLADRCKETVPTILQYRTHIKNDSMFNTPPTFGIYIIKLVMDWIQSLGGLEKVEEINEKKAAILYDAIDSSDFYYCPVEKSSRSKMNVVFRVTGDKEDLEAELIAEATKKGLNGLKGHRSVGGLRASIYNAHPVAGVEALVAFMKEFEQKKK